MIKKALTRLQALQVEIGNAFRPNLAKLKEEKRLKCENTIMNAYSKKKFFGGKSIGLIGLRLRKGIGI